jgi:hypothetical protein
VSAQHAVESATGAAASSAELEQEAKIVAKPNARNKFFIILSFSFSFSLSYYILKFLMVVFFFERILEVLN